MSWERCHLPTCPTASGGSPCSAIPTATRSGCGRDGRSHQRRDALRALAEARRRAILELVATEEIAAGEIAAHFEVTRTAISQHLTVLKGAGLLDERKDGARRLYRARPAGLVQLRGLLDGMWASSLDVARRLVEAEVGVHDDH